VINSNGKVSPSPVQQKSTNNVSSTAGTTWIPGNSVIETKGTGNCATENLANKEYTRLDISNAISNKQDIAPPYNKDNLQGIDFSLGYSKVGGAKGGVQILQNGNKDYILIYRAAGTDVGAMGIQSGIGYVYYNTTDIEKLRGLSGDVGGTVNTAIASGGYSRFYTKDSPVPIGETLSAGPAAKTPGMSVHVMMAQTLAIIPIKRPELSLEVIDKYSEHH
jgi:hypothetical protein